jgi:acetylornithine deacetylase/succinyl-diaminopimelate desuccinylase family protein
MKPDVVELAQSLIAVPSVNPMVDPAENDPCESLLTDHLETLFAQLGIKTFRQPVHPRRDNLFALIESTNSEGDPNRLLLFDTHQDTVPVAGMTIDPFDPKITDGKLYGRGACDEKGAMAAMIVALARLAEEQPAGMPTVVFSATVNEENGFTGARAAAASWSDGSNPFLPRLPDAVIVAEPTEMHVVVAHKGVLRWRCHVHGRAAHSSNPAAGENAIFGMRHVLQALAAHQQELAASGEVHPLCGGPTLNIGMIDGGISPNTVPDLATIIIDRRLMPNEDPPQALQQVIAFVADHTPADLRIEHEPPFLTASGMADGPNRSLADQLCAIASPIAGDSQQIGVPFGTNASAYAPLGVPTVVFGPGSIAQAHTADEWIAIEQLHMATEIYYQFAKSIAF